MADSEFSQQCLICCGSLKEPAEDKPSPSMTLSKSSPEGKVLLTQFCDKFLPRPLQQNRKLWRSFSTCSNCSRNLSKVLDTRERVNEVEGHVRELQLQVLQELKELKLYLELLGCQLETIESCVKRRAPKPKETSGESLEGDEDGGSGSKIKRSRGRPRKDNVDLKKKLHEEHDQVRKCIANVTTDLDLDIFRDSLEAKTNCGTTSLGRHDLGISEGSCCGVNSSYTSSNSTKSNPKSMKFREEYNGGDPDSEEESENKSDSDSEYVPPPSPPGSPIEDEFPPPSPSSASRTTLLVKKIKLEPTSEPESDDEDEMKMNVHPEETNPVIEELRKKFIKSGAKMNRNFLQNWSHVKIPDEVLKKDFRRAKHLPIRNGTEITHYCAYGVSRSKCPVRVKVRELVNGTRLIFRNKVEHSNHRKEGDRLTEAQKAFAHDCVLKGVTKPSNILHLFREAGLRMPEREKLKSFLGRQKGRILATAQQADVKSSVATDPKPPNLEEGAVQYSSEVQDQGSENSTGVDEALKMKVESGEMDFVINETYHVDPDDADDYDGYELCEKSGKVIHRGAIERNWNPIKMSEEELKKDFRVSKQQSLKDASQTLYYCVHARKRLCCPVRVKVKRFPNGVNVFLQNNEEHDNHREGTLGLTQEQKDFVKECQAIRVTTSWAILQRFKDAGLEAPDAGKVRSYLGREKRRLKAAEEFAAEMAGGNEKTSEHEIQFQEAQQHSKIDHHDNPLSMSWVEEEGLKGQFGASVKGDETTGVNFNF